MSSDPARAQLLRRAFEAGAEANPPTGLLQHDRKKRYGSKEGVALGALFTSRPMTVSAEPGRRLLLSQLSLKVARLRRVTGWLLQKRSYNWNVCFEFRKPLLVALDKVYKVVPEHALCHDVMALPARAADDYVLASALAPAAVLERAPATSAMLELHRGRCFMRQTSGQRRTVTDPPNGANP